MTAKRDGVFLAYVALDYCRGERAGFDFIISIFYFRNRDAQDRTQAELKLTARDTLLETVRAALPG